jgi:uncharacterized protein (TIGR03084 family)
LSLPDALADMRAEADALAILLDTLTAAQLGAATPFSVWHVEDVIRHLIVVDRHAVLAVTDPAGFQAAMARLIAATSQPVPHEPVINPGYARLLPYERTEIGAVERTALVPLWHRGVETLAAAVDAETEDRKIGWFGPPMPVSRLLGARQMELWCYGQDIYDALGIRRPGGDHIRTVAAFGMRTRSYCFRLHGLEPPPAPLIRLIAPSGLQWVWGEQAEDRDQISGLAADFCAVVTQRRHVADTGLHVTGAGAAQWMAIAQTIAGGPYVPPAPGERSSASN